MLRYVSPGMDAEAYLAVWRVSAWEDEGKEAEAAAAAAAASGGDGGGGTEELCLSGAVVLLRHGGGSALGLQRSFQELSPSNMGIRDHDKERYAAAAVRASGLV